ncbi:MAG TPA: MFS transporter [Syntrophobacteria bacterium]|nr:MFS transporter [Syntrophobacteria bacterium]
MATDTRRPSFVERLGLGRRELRAWAMYDWANSAFVTTVIAAVFPIYYEKVAAAGVSASLATFRYGMATAIALAVVAVMAPPLGALADVASAKKRLLALFQGIGLVATVGMFFIYRGDWSLALWLFVVGNIGISGAFTFYDSLLPHIAQKDELDQVSTAGYALGYLGGGLLLALNLLWIQKPAWFGLADSEAASRLSFLSVAVWWLLFSIPLFRGVPEPIPHGGKSERAAGGLVAASFKRLGETLRDLRRYRQAFLMLIAFLIYNDGINTIIRMAALYGSQIGIAQGDLLTALLLVQFAGIPFSFLFGRVAAWVGPKRAIFLALGVYVLVSILGYFMRTALHFYLLSILVAMVQGGSQALSRSVFAAMIPRQKSAEFFGFFAVFERFAGIIGPLLFASTAGATGSSRIAVLSVAAFFLAGSILLALVNVPEGERVAREAEREVSVNQE